MGAAGEEVIWKLSFGGLRVGAYLRVLDLA